MPILVGHRGAPLRRTENTLESLAVAQDLGADAVELDVRGTRDSHPILLHDRTLQRFFGDPRSPGELTLAELGGLAAVGTGEHIPTLAQVVEAVRVRLVVDGKEPALVPAMVAILRAGSALDRSCFIGEPEVLTVVREHLPDAEVILSWPGPQLPPGHVLDQIRPQAINVLWERLTADLVQAARRQGLSVWSYGVDDAAQAQQASAWGLAAVITNDLPTVAEVLRSGVTP